MHKYFLLLAFIVIVGCDRDESPTITELIEIEIDNETFTFSEDNVFMNENCGNVFLNTSPVTSGDSRFRIEMVITTNGRIKDVTYIDLSNNNSHFKAADYVPAEVFFIENYNFSPTEKTMNFEFNGTLYEIDNSQNTKSITGKVKTDNLEFVDCLFEPWKISADINQENFNVVDIQGDVIETAEADGTVISVFSEWEGISDDGFRIAIITQQRLEDMETGTYPFGKNNSLNLVIIEKYNGPYEAIKFEDRNGEWENFQYEGELIIEEQISIPLQRTKGSFTINAYKDDQVVYSVRNGRFSI